MKSPSKKSLEVVNLKRADNTNKKRGKYTNNDTHCDNTVPKANYLAARTPLKTEVEE